MHKHIEWDAPGTQSVEAYYAQHPEGYSEPHPGSIVSGRHEGVNVRVKVAAYKDAVTIGDVVAIIDSQGQRLKRHGKLDVGNTVRLPDDMRAFEAIKALDESDKI